MSLSLSALQNIRDAAAGKRPADLLIKNARILNTITQEMHLADLAVCEGYIVGFAGKKANQVIDAEGMYVSPLLIDAHMHIESTLLTPAQLNDILLARGIGDIIADPHEIANVAGKEGIRYILEAVRNLDVNFHICLPSCVPATSFEHSGAVLKAEDLREFYEDEHVIGLAEVMDYFGLRDEEDMLQKVYDARIRDKVVDGHGAILDDTGLDVYGAMRIANDHECVTRLGMRDRLRRGIYTFIREGTVTKNLKELVGAVNYRNYRYVCLCTDDKHPDDLATEGGIDGVVRMAIAEGIDPVLAISMATLNPATCYSLKDQGAVAPGYKADFFLFEDLHNMQAKQVYRNGKLVAENGTAISPKKHCKTTVSDKILHSVNYKDYQVSDLQINLGEATHMRMIEVSPGNVLTKLVVEEVRKNMFDQFMPSVARDQAKLAVIERHNATGKIGLAAVKGFGLLKGAIATTVAHDSHNIIAIGTNDFDMVMAIEQLKKSGGGYVIAVDGKIWAKVDLPIGGLMSDQNLDAVLCDLHKLHTDVGYITKHQLFNPFLMLSFISLPVIPEVKLTDMGLVDVRTGQFLSLPVLIKEIEEED